MASIQIKKNKKHREEIKNDCNHHFIHYHMPSCGLPENQYLAPIKVYCRLTNDDCRGKFDAKAMQLFYGKPIGVFKGVEQKNSEYILMI